jgi:hypothetical protein
MAAETAGHLDIVPGSKIADTHAMTTFGEDDNVPVSFHAAMLGVVKRRRPAVLPHGQADFYEGVSKCSIGAQALCPGLWRPFQKFV